VEDQVRCVSIDYCDGEFWGFLNLFLLFCETVDFAMCVWLSMMFVKVLPNGLFTKVDFATCCGSDWMNFPNSCTGNDMSSRESSCAE
jgi:hypothetical protein